MDSAKEKLSHLSTEIVHATTAGCCSLLFAFGIQDASSSRPVLLSLWRQGGEATCPGSLVRPGGSERAALLAAAFIPWVLS